MVRRKDIVSVSEVAGIERVELGILWRGLGHVHSAAPGYIEPVCRWHGLIEDCPRTRREKREGAAVA